MADNGYTVSELLTSARDAINDRLGGPVWVEGEISGFKKGRNNHTFFNLVEKDESNTVIAQLSVALWAGNKSKVNGRFKDVGPIRMDDGVRVRIIGPLELWVPGGRIQLSMQDIDPEFTLELIASERDRVLQMLRAEGLFDRNRQLPMPSVPLRIGLVTATESAAEADFLKTLADSGLNWEIVFADSRVQGIGAERTVAAALRTVAAQDVDLIALVRGGGARTDLATFDHELIARTIVGLDVPVFTGIGHEIDTSVADLVAFASHKTPTACASAIADLALEAVNRAELAWQEIVTALDTIIDDESDRLSRRARRATSATRNRLVIEDHRLQGFGDRVRRSAAGAVRHSGSHLDLIEARVRALDPARALARGWSITRSAAGTVVRSVNDIEPGGILLTTVADGTISSIVSDAPTDKDNS
jgi:exodeoxyribonuclease VII large subunit